MQSGVCDVSVRNIREGSDFVPLSARNPVIVSDVTVRPPFDIVGNDGSDIALGALAYPMAAPWDVENSLRLPTPEVLMGRLDGKIALITDFRLSNSPQSLQQWPPRYRWVGSRTLKRSREPRSFSQATRAPSYAASICRSTEGWRRSNSYSLICDEPGRHTHVGLARIPCPVPTPSSATTASGLV
jgi:hypothetical protein